MSSPEIAAVNAVRWRMKLAAHRWQEATELLRQAAAAPGYCGPPLDVVERMAGVIGQIRSHVQAWHIEEQRRRASRPRIAAKGQRTAVRRAIARDVSRGKLRKISGASRWVAAGASPQRTVDKN
jgi:hypothetical protein